MHPSLAQRRNGSAHAPRVATPYGMLQHSPPRGNALRSAPSPPQEGEEENTPPELSNAANVRHSPPRKEPNAAVASAAAGVSLAAVREATAATVS